MYVDPETINISVCDWIVPLGSCLTKDLYWQVMRIGNRDIVLTTTFWNTLVNINDEELENCYYYPYSYCRECKVQSLQYKILHNIYPTMLRKNQWKVCLFDKCIICNEVDTIQHHFYTCADMVTFWSSLNGWWRTFCKACKIDCLQSYINRLSDLLFVLARRANTDEQTSISNA